MATIQLLKDEAYDKILKMINRGRFVYDKIYSLNALSNELNMSKTPVRDAIQKLSEENRIDILASRGFSLHKMSKEELLHHYHFSSAIEGYCANALAVQYGKGKCLDIVADMENTVQKMSTLLNEKASFDEYFLYDKRFHQDILESLGDDYISNLQYTGMGFYNHPELQQMQEAASREEIYESHRKILKCIQNQDGVGAYNALREHSYLMIRKSEELKDTEIFF